jgi:hypothetical protein
MADVRHVGASIPCTLSAAGVPNARACAKPSSVRLAHQEQQLTQGVTAVTAVACNGDRQEATLSKATRSRSVIFLMATLAFVIGIWLVPYVTWLTIRTNSAWSADEKLAILAIAATIGTGIAATISGPGLTQWLAEIRKGASSPDEEARGSLLSQINLLRTEVLSRRLHGQGSTLERHVFFGDVFNTRTKEFTISDSGRLAVRGQKFAINQIAEVWAQDPRRMVILGEPGYGKTVTSLILLGQVNSTNELVAELFPLSEWHLWQNSRKDSTIDEWISSQLILNYPKLGFETAKTMVANGQILPLFDGFDEVPERYRESCRKAIEAYSGRTAPFKPFVITSRPKEFLEIPLSWITADRKVVLLGLEAGQIIDALLPFSVRSIAWKGLRDNLRNGDNRLVDILASPLRFSIATQVYRDSDPSELVGLDVSAARDVLWRGFLDQKRAVFGSDSPTSVRRWLGLLASWMSESSSQRFSMPDLFRYANKYQRLRSRRKQKILLSAATGISVGLFTMICSPPLAALIAGTATAIGAWRAPKTASEFISGAFDYEYPGLNSIMLVSIAAYIGAAGVFLGTVFSLGVLRALILSLSILLYISSMGSLASELTPSPKRAQEKRARKPQKIEIRIVGQKIRSAFGSIREDPLILLIIPWFFILFSPFLAGMLLLLPMTLIIGRLIAQIQRYATRRLRKGRPADPVARILQTTDFKKITYACLNCAAASLALTLILRLYFPEYAVIDTGVAALVLSMCYVLFCGGFEERSRLRLIGRSFAQEGQLPADLIGFLDWCSHPERSWIRRSTDHRGHGYYDYRLQTYYEFRHRDLLEYLARDYKSKNLLFRALIVSLRDGLRPLSTCPAGMLLPVSTKRTAVKEAEYSHAPSPSVLFAATHKPRITSSTSASRANPTARSTASSTTMTEHTERPIGRRTGVNPRLLMDKRTCPHK